MRYLYFKLRANIELEGDISIAEREIRFFCSDYFSVAKNDLKNAHSHISISEINLLSNSRKEGVIGFIGSLKDRYSIEDIILKSSFIQEIWLEELLPTESTLRESLFCKKSANGFFCVVPLFPMGEFLTYHKKDLIQPSFINDYTSHLSNNIQSSEIAKTIVKSSTSTPHAHGLHKYKAKFFPRLIRTFLLSESVNDNLTVLDPFVGSGTSLVESAFFDYESIGVDIDKLSCLISQSKIDILSISVSDLKKMAEVFLEENDIGNHEYHFPSWISKKFDRWDTVHERISYEAEISQILGRLEKINTGKSLFQVAVSDALSRKFNIRMMGTGVGRFALEIQKTSLRKLLSNNIKFLIKTASVIQTLKEVYPIIFKLPKVGNGNATNLSDIPDCAIDIVLTSPPYLPASSGREDYLIGKSISITALGLLTESEIKQMEGLSVGSMKSNSTSLTNDNLPNQVHELYEFLRTDPLRAIKAAPTYAYYVDIRKSLLETWRVLNKGGKAVFVIGKESVFYTFKTREVLFTAHCDEIFKQIALEIGFEIKEIIDVELNKKNRNARPRALDKYYESVFVLVKS